MSDLREQFPCKVCLATPDWDGYRYHGRGCYALSEDGGGCDYVEECDANMLVPQMHDQLAAVTAERDRLRAEAEMAWGESRSNLDTGIVLIKQAQAERDRLREILTECRDKWDTAGNGKCSVCGYGHRLFDLKGNVMECENRECLSHRIREAIASVRGEET